MHRHLSTDLARLETLAFRRKARCGPLLERFFALKRLIAAFPDPGLIWNIYDWVLVPLSLWPIDFEGLAHHLLATLERGNFLSSSGGEGQGEEAAPAFKQRVSRIKPARA